MRIKATQFDADTRAMQKPPPQGRPNPDRREPLWNRVDRNRARLWSYVSLFSVAATGWIGSWLWVVFSVASWFVPGLHGSPLIHIGWDLALGAAASLAYVWWALARSERRLVSRLGATLVPKGEVYPSKMVLKDMAIAAGLVTAPAFYLVPSTNVNAFVFHALGRRPILGVTQGLVERLTLEQQRAVFANLVARVVAGDTQFASATTALVAPLQAWREHRIGQLDSEYDFLAAAAERKRYGNSAEHVRSTPPLSLDSILLIWPLFPFGIAIIFLGELLAAAHRRSQLTAAEKADAEGMLLLKDPGAMLSALQLCVEADNVVPTAGEALGELFYCWTGDSSNDEDDPEWTRVARLREVLGVEGHVAPDDMRAPSHAAPLAPRLDR